MTSKILMHCIPNAEIILEIKQIEKSIQESENILKRSYEPYKERILYNSHLHDARSLIRASIKCRQKYIAYLKTKLFIY